MRKIILYTASSLDDFIARKNGAIDWLENPEVIPGGEDFGYGAFYNSIDTTLMGNNTFRQVVGFGGPFPYQDKKNFVFSKNKRTSGHEHADFITGDPALFCREIKAAEGKDIWLVGGGEINTLLMENRLIDKLIITKIPIPLGSGIPLFHDADWKSKFQTVSTRVYEKGVVQLTMEPVQ